MLNHSKVVAQVAAHVLLLAGAIGMVSCSRDEPLAPQMRPATNQIASANDTMPFYYYQGEKIFLTADPTRLVVSKAAGRTPLESAEAARTALANAGLSVDSAVPVPGAAGHSLLFLPKVAMAATNAAFQRLRHDAQFRFVSRAYKTQVGGHDFIPLDRVIVRFKKGVTSSQVIALADSLSLTVERPPRPDSGFAEYWLTYPSDSTVEPLTIAARLDRHPLIAWADPDVISDRHADLVPTDPFFGYQYYLKNTSVFNGVPVDINVEPAWDLTTGSSTIKVAVLDEGIDVSHPELGSALVGGYDTFSGFAGEDAYHPCTTPCTAVPNVIGDPHGTAAAGIVAARQNNAQGMSGVAPNIRLISVRVLRNNIGNSAAYMANGINWAWNTAHADVLSNSWSGGSPSNAVTNAIHDASIYGRNGLGSVVVFSAGNDARNDLGLPHGVNYPATLTSSLGIIAVGAIDRYGSLSYYSNTGSELTVVAPTSGGSNDVTTTDLVGVYGYNGGPSGNSSYTTHFGGTSASAPQVSGVAALLLSREPGLNARQVRDRVGMGSDSWGAASQFGQGKLNAYQSLVDFQVIIDGPTLIRRSGPATWKVDIIRGSTGSYTYTWEESYNGSSWSTVSTGATYSKYVYLGDPAFWLRVSVNSGLATMSDSRKINVAPAL